jgi:hypothetical protein
MLQFLLRMYAVFGGRPSLFLVQMYMGRPPYIHSVNSTRTYVRSHGRTLFFKIPFGYYLSIRCTLWTIVQIVSDVR